MQDCALPGILMHLSAALIERLCLWIVFIIFNLDKTGCMKKLISLLSMFLFLLFYLQTTAQTNKDIQGTWRVLSTIITNDKGDDIFRMDSATHNLTKIITLNRVTFTIYNKKTDSLVITGQGSAVTKGNQYIETFEQSTSKRLLKQPMIFTYKVQGNKLSYEGGAKDFHIVEVLQRIE